MIRPKGESLSISREDAKFLIFFKNY